MSSSGRSNVCPQPGPHRVNTVARATFALGNSRIGSGSAQHPHEWHIERVSPLETLARPASAPVNAVGYRKQNRDGELEISGKGRCMPLQPGHPSPHCPRFVTVSPLETQ